MTRVLVVDDEEPIRSVVAEFLGDEGYLVGSAPEAEQALDLLRASSQPTVLLVDHGFKGTKDDRLLRAVRADADLRGRVAAVLMTAESRSDAEALAAGLGVPLLLKPFELDELLIVVREAAGSLAAPA